MRSGGMGESFLEQIEKVFLAQIGNDRVEEKERLTKEWWKANFWKRLNTQMHAAQIRSDNLKGFRLELPSGRGISNQPNFRPS